MTHSFREEFRPKIERASFQDLSINQIEQLLKYLWIYRTEYCSEHWEVNEHITENNLWGDFLELRSLNNHGYTSRIKGITPKFFAIVCKVLSVGSGNGAHLKGYQKY
jgi:hypothetical protein